jgi:8-oxo-dGTP diphosphatase
MNPTIVVVAAVIEEHGRYLVTQRRPTAVLPLLWEFPGGRVEAGETDLEALQREVAYRVGFEIKAGARISTVSHAYEHYTVELHLYECRVLRGEPRAVNVHQFRWVASDEFEGLPFTPADEASMSKLLGLPPSSN